MTAIIEWMMYAVGGLVIIAGLVWALCTLMSLIMKDMGMFWRICWCVGNWEKVQAYMAKQSRECVNARAYCIQDEDSRNGGITLPAYEACTNAHVILQDGWSRGAKAKQVLAELEAQGYSGWTRDSVKLQFELFEQDMPDDDHTLDYGELRRKAESMSKNFKGPQP